MRMPTPAALFALLTACGRPSLPPLEAGPVAVSVHLAEKRVASGDPVLVTVRVATAAGWSVADPVLAVEGLTAAEQDPPASTLDGTRTVVTKVVALTGADGSYILDVPPLQATGPTEETQSLDPPALFFDVGVDGPSSNLTGFETTPEDPGVQLGPWRLFALFLVAGALGMAVLLWRRRSPPPEASLTPEAEARQRWARAKAKAKAGDLDDAGLALALSTLFRTWLEATLAFPATARTSREILEYLEHNGLLLGDDRTRSERLLTATDRLKFAREGGGDDFFADLDSDLDAILVARETSTREEQDAADLPAEEVDSA